MFLALEDGKRIEASVTGDRAACPQCKAIVIAKCGRRVAHHWAHEVGADCDPWSEGMTQWHLDWQGCWPESQRELVIGEHRTDVFTWLRESMPWLVRRGAWHYFGGVGIGLQVNSPIVVEFQNSYLSVDEIEERQAYYGRSAGQMIWVWDCRKAFEARRLYLNHGGRRQLFTWKHFRSTLTACTYPVFLDLGKDELLLVTEWPPYEMQYGEITEWGTSSWMGWGSGSCRQVSRRAFIRALQFPKP